MTTFTIAQAARHLGVSDNGARKMIGRAELTVLPGSDPVRLDAGHVDAVLKLRQAAAVHDLVRRRSSAVQLAQEARRILLPAAHESRPLPDRSATSWALRMSLVPVEAKTLFGLAALTAVGCEDGCRWCRAGDFARVLGGWAPDSFGEGFEALFGQKPCGVCGPALYAPVLASLRARVHPSGVGSSAASVAPTAAEREAAREWVQRRPVTPAARPVGDDDGRALVAAGLRTARARLKDAKRRGDQRHVLQLAQTIRALERDAAVVDGRAGAVVKPGRLKCGHALAANCGCPRSSARGQR
jgi:hypothetical protein